MLGDSAQLTRCFGRELAFGTGGLRGVLGVGTDRMNQYTVARATEGLARYLAHEKGQSVAIAYDSRIGSQAFALVTAGVLAAHGIRAYLFPRLMPTPVLSYATRALGAAAGVMITASHNPAEYNGYKVYGADGCQITDKAAAAITAEIDSVDYASLHWPSESETRESGLLKDIPETVLQAYLEQTLACRVYPNAASPLTVCYTPLNGAGLEPVTRTLAAMRGVTFTLVEAQAAADGHFPTCPQPNPELRPTLELALQTAAQQQAALVIATDPDSDRLGVAVCEHSGAYTVLTGNEVGLLLTESTLKARQSSSGIPEGGEVVKTIVTSDLVYPIAQAYGANVRDLLTGFKYIGEEIGRLEKAGHAERFLFGFEESCGYLLGTHVRDKDGVLAAMLVCELAQVEAAAGRTLCDTLAALYARYGYVGTRLLSFDIGGADPMAQMHRMMGALRDSAPTALAGQPVTAAVDYLPGVDSLPPADVLVYRCQGGKAIVRPSGTEPKVKVYLSARAATAAPANTVLDAMEADVRRWLA